MPGSPSTVWLAKPRIRASLSMVVLSANTSNSPRTQALNAGANYFLAKPYDGGALVALIESIVGAPGPVQRSDDEEEVKT